MSVAVIIPNRNYEAYIARSVNSAFWNRPDDVIVVDGESTDRSPQIASRLGARVIVTPARGQADARNVGIRATTCDYIVPLDADDWIEENFVERCLPLMDDPATGVVATGLVWPSGRVQWPVPPFTPEAFLTGNRLFCCSLFRRQCFIDVGGYSTDSGIFEDWAFWARIVLAGWKIAMVREPLFHYHPHEGSSTDKMKHRDAEYRQRTIGLIQSWMGIHV